MWSSTLVYSQLLCLVSGNFEPSGLTRREQLGLVELDDAVVSSHGSRKHVAVHHKAPRDVAAVVVFGFSKDPQRGTNYTKDSLEHIDSWKQSCERLKMPCLVIHDSTYSTSFVEKQGGQWVSFHKMSPVSENGTYEEPDLRELTTSDMRFIAMLNYLKSPAGTDVEYGLLTDSHDVVFRRDPIKLMRAMDGAMGSHYIFGQDEWRPRVSMSGNATGTDTALNRLVDYYKACFGSDMPQDFLAGRMPNCGIIGGHRSVLIPFLERMRHWYTTIDYGVRFQMCDMLVFMRTVNEDYGDRIITGYPFHAKFKQSDVLEEAAIYHKNDAWQQNP